MASDLGRTPLLVRFLDSFLQERNIKWLLGVGVIILLSSTLLPVTMYWNKCAPASQYLILLAYVALLHGAGQWLYHKLGLRRTGTVMQGLTVLLLPVLFLALRWVPLESPAWTDTVIHLTLLGSTCAFGLAAAHRIFAHFLRGTQFTFLASYFLLALAGALLPTPHEAWAPVLALFLWAVFAIGTVKVNRRVFWLTEESRSPRIFGFFPILLLGGQFLALFVLCCAPHLSEQRLGLGYVLLAVPILLTADAVAGVFQQRTGDLVRSPLPWSILLPLLAGLTLCLGGVVLSGLSLVPPSRPHELVLSAALAAILMAVVAHRTGKTGFVWAMLFGILLAYNFSPSFFLDLARAVLQQGAHMVAECKLPLAFYGLTYLPLILSLLVATRFTDELFARPLRRFAFGLSLLLLAASLGHIKAIFPVGLVMVAVFALQAILFRDRRPALPAILAWISAAYGFAPFLEQVFGLALPANTQLYSLAFAAGTLLIAGVRIDSALAKLAHSDTPGPLCQLASLLLTFALAAAWLSSAATPILDADNLAGLVLTALLLIHSLRWIEPRLSGIALLFTQIVLLHQLHALGLPPESLWSTAILLFAGQWLLACILDRIPTTRIVRTFALPGRRIALAALILAWTLVLAPQILLELLIPLDAHFGYLAIGSNLEWPCRLVLLAWALLTAIRERHSGLTWLTLLGLFGLAGSALLQLGDFTAEWIPSLWTALACACLPLAEYLQRCLRKSLASDDDEHRYRSLSLPLDHMILAVLCLAQVGSLVVFGGPLRVAGLLALGGLATFAALRRQPEIRVFFFVLANWQALCFTIYLFAPQIHSIFAMQPGDLLPLCLPLAFVSAVTLALWQALDRSAFSVWQGLLLAQRCFLRALIVLGLAQSLELAGLERFDVLFAAGTFLFVAAGELMTAVRRKHEVHVWAAESIVFAGVLYLLHFHVFVVGSGASLFVVLGVGLCLWLARQLAEARPSLGVLIRPFHYTAFAMPAVAVVLGIYRHIAYAHPDWLGANSLALLLAGAFYFWRGIEDRRKSLILAAAAILNIALMLLWRDLDWTDPQFFLIPIGVSFLGLVQLLRDEIPSQYHDVLRYIGALAILVSPTFHIVNSWVHLLTLMVLAVGIVLVSIGLRVRALMYMGTSFLIADLVAMVVRGSLYDANVLWMTGLALGTAVLALGALCERNREQILARMRLLAESLKNWD